MPSFRRTPSVLLCLPALAACQTLTPAPSDPQVAELTRTIVARSNAFYASLATARAPECDFAHNAAAYDEIGTTASQLQERLAAAAASKPLRRAADALSRSIAGARLSHEKASAITSDPAGACMTGEAIALNAHALARAGNAIAQTQAAQGDR